MVLGREECACWGTAIRCLLGLALAGVLTLALAAGRQPCRCLWRRFSQMTITRPWRRMTLHLSQIGLTLGLTFTVLLLICYTRSTRERVLLVGSAYLYR